LPVTRCTPPTTRDLLADDSLHAADDRRLLAGDSLHAASDRRPARR